MASLSMEIKEDRLAPASLQVTETNPEDRSTTNRETKLLEGLVDSVRDVTT